MAYGVKWYSYFSDLRDAGEGNYLVEVLERDFAGASVRVKSGEDACAVEMEDVPDPFHPVRSIKFTFNWISREDSPFDIQDLIITDDLKYKLRLSKLDASDVAEVLFHGFVVPINAEQPFLPKSYVVSFTGSCGLPLLRDVYYLDAFGAFVEGNVSLIKIIANCLASTEHELPIHTTINLYEAGMSLASSPLSQAIINADGLRGMKAYDVLFKVLSSLRAFIVQSSGVWHIIRVKEQASYSGKVWKFTANGDAAGSETRVQAAAFGRMEYIPDVPRVKPIRKSVKESVAMRNSVVTASISPGIPVNRLANGTFSGPVLGTISGWNNHIGSIDWARGGFGTPDDPYRIEFSEHIEFDPKKKKRAFKPFAYFDSGPITLNVGDFNIPSDKRKPTKIVLRGAFKSNNALSCTFMLSINETEREFNDYLDDNGDWFYSKKEDRTYNVRAAQSVYEPVVKTYHDIKDLQEFEIESKKITNLLNRPEGALAVLRLRIFPGIQGPGYNSHAFLSIEDLMLYVVEDSVYEGAHKYRIDTKSKIRNPNPADFSMIIADKIDITTPEQSRVVNRVMTGYMTLPGGALTHAWKSMINGSPDPTDGIVEPIQKKALRETVRLLCGRRDIFEGPFHGFGLMPIHSVYSGYDEPVDPSVFFTITQWKWKPKSMEYMLRLSELNFEPLPNEDIFLTDDSGGMNRMYRGSSSSAGGSSSKPQGEEIVFDDIPPVYFTVGEQAIKVVDLTEYLSSAHQPYTLTDRELHYTDWVSYVVIDRGELGFDLELQVTAWPTKPGTDRVLVEFISAEGNKYILIVPLVALMPVKTKSTLLENIGIETSILGPIPGVYEWTSNPLDISTQIKGLHNKYELILTGEGVNESLVQEVEGTEDGTYQMFAEVGGKTLEPGQYKYTVNAYRDEQLARSDSGVFVLADEEYLAKVKASLIKGGSPIGEISLDGTSVFDNPDGGNLRVVIADVEHDTVTLQLTQNGNDVPNGGHTFTLDPAETDGTYDLFVADQQLLGAYSLSVVATLEGEEVVSRFFDFEISDKKAVAQGGGLKLVRMTPGTSNYSVLGTLSLSGGSFDLPANWNLLCDAVSDDFDWQGGRLFELRGGFLVEVNIALYTGNPQSESFANAIDESNYLFFGDRDSTDIDSIHHTPSTFRAILTRRIGGANGEIVAVYSADFSFGPAVNIDDDTEVTEPGGNGLVDYKGRRAIEEEIVDSVKYFDTITDEASITVNGDNELEVKNKGITLDKIIDLTPRSVLGNPGSIPGIHIIPVKDIFDDIEDGELVWGIAIKDYIQEQLSSSISGTANFIPKFSTDGHSIVDSVIREIGGNIGIGITPTEKLHVLGNIRAVGSLYSSIITGTPPIAVNSTTWVANLNVDMLDDQHGSYYLNWNNFTNYKSIIAGTGLSGGGILSADRTLSVVYGTTAGTAAQGNDPRIVAGQAGFDRWVGQPIELTDVNNIKNGGVKAWNNTAANRPTSFGTALTFVGNTSTGDSAASGFTHQILAATTGDWYVRYGPGATPSWGTLYQMWTTKQFTSTDVTNWNTAFSWGDHAGLYVPITRQVIAGTGLSGGGVLNADRTLNVVYGSTAGTSAQGNDPRIVAGQSASDRWVGQPIELTDVNNITGGGVKGWNNTAANRPASFGTALTFIGNTSTGNSASGGFTHQILGATTGDWFVRYGAGAAPSWGSTYQVWTTKQFTQTDVTNWDTAFGWGNHAGLYVPIARQVIAGTGLTGGGQLNADRTLSVVYGTSSGTAAQGNDSRITNGQSAFNWGDHAGLYVPIARQILNGAGITGGGQLNADRTISLTTTGVGAGTYRSVTVDVYGRISGGSNPTTLAGYGLDSTVYTKSQVDALIAGAAYIDGSGSAGYISKFSDGDTITNSPIYDSGSEINIANTRSFGVEGPAAMRDYLHVHGYCNMGTSSNHGTLLLHQANSGTIDGAAAFEIRSTSKGVLFPRMTTAQRRAISSPPVGLIVYQTDSSGPNSNQGIYFHLGAGVWSDSAGNYIGT